VSARVPGIETIAADATRRHRAGERAPLVHALGAALAPCGVLEIGASGASFAGVLPPSAVRSWLGIGACAEAVHAARARLGDAVELHHASLLADAAAPHLTRVPPLVGALCAGFDVVFVEPPARAGGLYLTLAQALPLVAPGGVLACGGLGGDADTTLAVRRLAAESAGPAVLWQPDEGGPATLLAGVRPRRWSHADTAGLRALVLADEPGLAASAERGDDAAVCARLRHWLAARLAWSTRDLLLPLAALPPALGVRDVVAECARGEGGVWSWGAAVTLAMLYRAFGYAATVYQHGVPELYRHMVTLVRLPDGRILVEDAFFDAEPRFGDHPATWTEVLTLARAGRTEVLAFASDARMPRPHLYSRASLSTAEADGWLTATERAALAAAMDGCRRLRGEPRAILPQHHTTSPEAFAALPVHARALAAIRDATGIATPLGLLALPCGVVPLTGEPRFDAEVIAALGPSRAAGATAEATA